MKRIICLFSLIFLSISSAYAFVCPFVVTCNEDFNTSSCIDTGGTLKGWYPTSFFPVKFGDYQFSAAAAMQPNAQSTGPAACFYEGISFYNPSYVADLKSNNAWKEMGSEAYSCKSKDPISCPMIAK